MSGKTFRFMDWELEYFTHPYNQTAQNMRAVEIPIARKFLEFSPGRILEIGNVLSHYQQIDWPVVDFREKGNRIINADVTTWRPNRLYDTIISISTIEHIGHGKYAHITKKTPAQAVEHIKSFLQPGGKALFTVPIGYNKTLDRQLAKGIMPVDEIHYMRRISDKNEWIECNLIEAAITERPAGYHWAVALAVLLCEAV
jgi:SAM-dependent methyltransferase